MAQDYNVDDILNEIRRKKQQEAPPSGGSPRSFNTYEDDEYKPRSPQTEQPRTYREPGYKSAEQPLKQPQTRPQRTEDARVAGVQRPVQPRSGFSDDLPQEGGRSPRPSAFPVRARQEDTSSVRPQRSAPSRPAEPERPRYTEPERPRFTEPERSRFTEPERPRYTEPERPRYTEPERPRYTEPERPRYTEPERPRFTKPERSRFTEPERPRYTEPERPRYTEPERPRYTEPEHLEQSRRTEHRQPETERRAAFEFIDGTQLPKKAPMRQQFDFEAPNPVPEQPKPSGRRQFDYDTAETTPIARAESLEETMRRVRSDVPDDLNTRRLPQDEPPIETVQGNGFTFRASDPSPQEDDFKLPAWEDEDRFGTAGFVDPMDIPLPDGKRSGASGRGSGRDSYGGNTQEVDSLVQPVSFRQSKQRQRRREREEGPESIVQSQWKQGYAAQEQLEQEMPAEDDFASPEDAPFVGKDIKSIRVGLFVKLNLTCLLAFISIYLTLSLKVLPFAKLLGLKEDFLLPLPEAIFPEENMRLFLIVNLVVCVLAAVVCSNIVGGGIAALCKMRADSDSPAALAMFGVLIQGIVLSILPESVYKSKHISLYFSVAIIALLFNLIGKIMLIKRVERNFNYLVSDEDKYAFVQIQNREFAREFSRGLGPDVDRVAYTTKTDFLTGFLDKSYSPDYSDTFSRLIVPITLVGALAVGGVTFFFAEDPVIAVSAFTAVLCITAPFSCAVIPNLMLSKVSKKLTRKGAMLAGYESAEDYSDTSAVIINDKDLYSEDCVMMHGMKVFAEKRIDEAILDAASVILSCNGIMSGVFMNMIGGNERLLKKVDSLMYEDSMGISAWVDGKRVLIGSQELMRNHGIDCPSKDFESRFVRDGRQVLYIANSGELSAMFVISYNADPETADLLGEMEQRGISFVVYTNDPNITGDLIAASFGVKRSSVKVLPAKMHGEYAYIVRPKERVAANGAHAGGLDGVLSLIQSAAAVKQSVINGTILQLIGVIVGYGLVAFMAFTGSLSLASFSTLILFNLAWLVVSSIAASVAKR